MVNTCNGDAVSVVCPVPLISKKQYRKKVRQTPGTNEKIMCSNKTYRAGAVIYIFCLDSIATDSVDHWARIRVRTIEASTFNLLPQDFWSSSPQAGPVILSSPNKKTGWVDGIKWPGIWSSLLPAFCRDLWEERFATTLTAGLEKMIMVSIGIPRPIVLNNSDLYSTYEQQTSFFSQCMHNDKQRQKRGRWWGSRSSSFTSLSH